MKAIYLTEPSGRKKISGYVHNHIFTKYLDIDEKSFNKLAAFLIEKEVSDQVNDLDVHSYRIVVNRERTFDIRHSSFLLNRKLRKEFKEPTYSIDKKHFKERFFT